MAGRACPAFCLHAERASGCRPHGVAGALLDGSVTQGWYARHDHGFLGFEPDPGLPVWDADLVEDTVRWRRHD